MNSLRFKQFINLISSEKQRVSRGLQSCTTEISIIKAMIGGKTVVVIDTPGIDPTRADVKEAEVLSSIACQLAAM